MVLKALKDLLPNVIKKIGVHDQNWTLLTVVENELKNIAQGINIAGFKNNKLYIEVESSALLQELFYRKREILKKIHSIFPNSTESIDLKFFIKGTASPTRKEKIDHRI